MPPFVFDAHVDSLLRTVDLGHDLGTEGPGHLDLVRGRRGGLSTVVLTAWCEPRFIEPGDPGAHRAPAPPWTPLHSGGRTDGRTDGRTGGRTADGRADGRTDGRADGRNQKE